MLALTQIEGVTCLPSGSQGSRVMTDLEVKLEGFETLATECDLIGKLSADRTKRELYLRLGQHYRELADDMRTVIATANAA